MQPPQPPQTPIQPQQYSGQYPQYASPYHQPPTAPLPRSGRKTALVVVVVVVLAIAALGVTASFLRGPDMALTNFQLTDHRSCGAFGSGNGYVAITFDLVNTGGSGFASIAYTLDSVADHTNVYHVPGGNSLPVHDSVFAPDCSAHNVQAQITAQRAG